MFAQAPLPRFAVREEMRVSGTANQLSPISQLRSRRDSAVWVWQRQDAAIRLFGGTGRPILTFGRSGAGPGEFRAPGTSGWIADTLWVLDPSLRRTTFISPQGKLIRTASWPGGWRLATRDTVSLPTFLGVAPRAIYRDGSFLFLSPWPQGVPRPGWYPTAERRWPMLRLSADGVFKRVVGWVSLGSADCAVSVGSRDLGIPFCASPLHSIATDGSRIAILVQRNETGPTAQFTLTMLDQDGDTVFSKPYDYIPQRISRISSDSALAGFRRLPGLSKEIIAAVDGMRLPVTYQPARRLLVGGDRSVWIEVNHTGPDHRWLLIGERGDVVGTLDLPVKISIHEASRDAILVTEEDDDGVQSVVRYHIVRLNPH